MTTPTRSASSGSGNRNSDEQQRRSIRSGRSWSSVGSRFGVSERDPRAGERQPAARAVEAKAASEDRSERTRRCVSEDAEAATHASGVQRGGRVWRRGRDSNPRWVAPNRISSAAP